MWLVNVLVLASGIPFSLLQTPASNQILSGEKPDQAAERPASSVPSQAGGPRFGREKYGACDHDSRLLYEGGWEQRPWGNPCRKQITRKEFERL